MNSLQLQTIQEFVYKESERIVDQQHALTHAERVKLNSVRIAEILELNHDLDKNLLMAMSLLHDMHFINSSPGIRTYLFERKIAKKFIKKAVSKFNLTKDEKNILIEAISNHPHSYPFKRLNRKKDHYSKILQDADTLDFFSDLRLKTFTDSKQKFFFYKLIWIIGNKLYFRGRKNIHKFLNYPQLINHLAKFNIS